MIIWLASYPKSGNTWIRALLTSYITNNSKDVFEVIKNIERFTKKNQFQAINKEKEVLESKNNIFKYFIPAQEKINLNNKLNMLKTHNFGGSIDGYPFSDKKNTAGVIYIVRDPRSVAVSYAFHANISFEESVNELLNPNLVAINNGFREARLSWKIHALSWMNSSWPRILIKYEDLHKETENHFKRILLFLSKFVKIEINDDKIKKTVEQCSFKNLSNLESQKGFEERKGKTNFFRKGSANEWQELLPRTLIEKIESNFNDEMKVLKYL